MLTLTYALARQSGGGYTEGSDQYWLSLWVRLQDGAIGKIIGPALSRGQFTKAVNQISSSENEFWSAV
jgi:hypothetical protein